MKSRGATSNAIAGLEMIHQIVNSPNSYNHLHNIALKMNLSKTFDRVEWSCLTYLMLRHGFSLHFIRLVSHCLTTSKIVIHFNNFKTDYFHPSRELRQGDPLSHLLFRLCMQGLSILLNNSLLNNHWKSIILRKEPLQINHLVFADDIILFGQDNVVGFSKTLTLLQTFCQASGQQINFDKSHVIFHKHAQTHFKIPSHFSYHALSRRYGGLSWHTILSF